MPEEMIIGGVTIKKGERKRVLVNVAKLYDFTDMGIPIEVVRGKKDGPVLFVSGAIHGDEINGTEIIRRLLTKKSLKSIKGTLIAVPIVNVFGFNTMSRYLPDRRDLNRTFPGSAEGSLTAQLAHTFMNEVIEHCTHGIDFHTAAINRKNLPQIRACLDDPTVEAMAKAFQMPVILHSGLRDGSLRAATFEKKIPTILFEGGEALRFNEKVIQSGLHGTIAVMREIGMLNPLKTKQTEKEVFIAHSSQWIRAPHSGSLSSKIKLGERVKKGQLLGIISDPFGQVKYEIVAKKTGIVIGAVTMPLLSRGDAVFHIASFEDATTVEEHVEMFEERLEAGRKDELLS
jgi:predicted deacylase